MKYDYFPIPIDILRRDIRYTINTKKERIVISLKYNNISDAYYISIFDSNLNPYIRGRRIVYGEDINYIKVGGLEGIKIVPISKYKKDEISGISKKNITNTVKLAIIYE